MITRWAVVVGAGSGIGAEVARRLDRRGFDIIAVDRTEELAATAVEALGDEAIGVACDLTDPHDVERLCTWIADAWADELEVLVCNAGVIVPGDLVDVPVEVIDRQLDVMLRSTIHLTRAALRVMVPRGRGHVLATVSMGGIVALPTSATYSAAKAGLRAFLAAVHAEVAGTGVRVSGIYPSAVDTDMLRTEAASGGSALNFLGPVQPVGAVADAYEKALETGRLEVYVPYRDSLTSRLVMLRPAALRRFVPLLARLGERGRTAYLEAAIPDPERGVDHEPD